MKTNRFIKFLNPLPVAGLMCAVLAVALTGCGTPTSKNELVIYSARGEQLIKPLFDAFQEETGVKVTYLTDKAGPLIQRLKAEGSETPADILITVDAGNLWQAQEEGLFKPVQSKVLRANIPAHLREPGDHWFGFSVRARTIVYNPKKVKPAELTTYEDLADPKWKGRLALRTSKKVYNQSLVAMMIAQNGAKETKEVVSGWVDNLATDVFSSDTQVLKAVAAGQGDIGIVNTYYYGRLIKKDPNFPLKIFWPNQKDTGVHVNISGAGMIKHSKKDKLAKQFLEWLSGQEAQKLFAYSNMEYPANPNVDAQPIVKAWGEFKPNLINIEKAGVLQKHAILLMDKVGYK